MKQPQKLKDGTLNLESLRIMNLQYDQRKVEVTTLGIKIKEGASLLKKLGWDDIVHLDCDNMVLMVILWGVDIYFYLQGWLRYIQGMLGSRYNAPSKSRHHQKELT